MWEGVKVIRHVGTWAKGTVYLKTWEQCTVSTKTWVQCTQAHAMSCERRQVPAHLPLLPTQVPPRQQVVPILPLPPAPLHLLQVYTYT